MSIKLNEKIMYDDEARKEVFFYAYVDLKNLSENLEKETEKGFCLRKGIIVEGEAYKNEMERMKVQLETLSELFSGEICRQYRIEEEEEEEYEMEI